MYVCACTLVQIRNAYQSDHIFLAPQHQRLFTSLPDHTPVNYISFTLFYVQKSVDLSLENAPIRCCDKYRLVMTDLCDQILVRCDQNLALPWNTKIQNKERSFCKIAQVD